MPIVDIKVSAVTREVKKKIVERVTETLSEVMTLPKEVFSIVITENEDDNYGVGGILLSELKKRRSEEITG